MYVGVCECVYACMRVCECVFEVHGGCGCGCVMHGVWCVILRVTVCLCVCPPPLYSLPLLPPPPPMAQLCWLGGGSGVGWSRGQHEERHSTQWQGRG